MSEVETAVKDSLQRQIKETHKQIEQMLAKSRKKDLELRRKRDQHKAKLIILTLYLKKQASDLEEVLAEHRKQWTFDFHSQESLILVGVYSSNIRPNRFNGTTND
jgi:hypothetical protein